MGKIFVKYWLDWVSNWKIKGYMYMSTRMCRHSTPFILATAVGLGGPSALPCGPSAYANQHLKFCFPWSYKAGLVFIFFRLDGYSLSYGVKHASFLHVVGRRAHR